MARVEAAAVWSLHYRLIISIIAEIGPEITALGLDVKELFVLAEIDENRYPAALATSLCMPKPTVTANLKRLEAAGFVRREIDPGDLRRHRLLLTPSGRRAMVRGVAVLSAAFGTRLDRLGATQQRELQALLELLS